MKTSLMATRHAPIVCHGVVAVPSSKKRRAAVLEDSEEEQEAQGAPQEASAEAAAEPEPPRKRTRSATTTAAPAASVPTGHGARGTAAGSNGSGRDDVDSGIDSEDEVREFATVFAHNFSESLF